MEDTVSYTYDANGNRATMVSKVNEHIYATTTYSYNLANMVVSMTNDPSNESAQTFTYTYYLDGNQRTKTEGTKVTTYAYDYAGRLVSEVTTDNGTPSVGYTYTYDDFGNRLTMTTDGVTTNYTYDLNNRLLQTTAGETTVTYTYNANGDMITEYKVVENIPEQNTTYTYSVYTGLLSSVSSTVGNVNASYDYNASGLRMKNDDTYFIYDGQNIVAEYDLANDEYTAVYGYAINRVSRFTSGVDGEIYLFNAHGDVVALVAISGENVGKTIKEYDYDAFGNEVFPDPDDENPFRYCGEYYDKGTNRLYLKARDYDASTGRFTSEDSARDGLNWYTYCINNPVMYSDPTGEFWQIVVIAIGLVAALAGCSAPQVSEPTPTPSPTVAPTATSTPIPTPTPTPIPTPTPSIGNMTCSDNIIEFIKDYEGGVRSNAYRGVDSNNRTIGYGHVITEEDGTKYDDGITKEEAELLLRQDLQKAIGKVNEYCNRHSISLNQNQFDALVSFVFNMGSLPESGDLFKALTSGNFDDMESSLPFWCAEDYERYLGLWRRRMDELDIFMGLDYTREYRTQNEMDHYFLTHK